MPTFVEGQDPLDQGAPAPGRMPMGPTPPDQFIGPTAPEVWGAAFRQNNPVVSVIDAISKSPAVAPPVPGYNPVPRLVGTKYESLLSQSLGDTNPDETTARMAKFDAEQKDQQMLADAGWGGTVAALAAGAFDPSWLIPIAGEARAGAELGIGARVLRGAGEGALRSGVSETALMSSQVSRTPGEAGADVATNTLLMGLIGGGARWLEGGERKGAVDGLEAMRRDLTPGAAPAMAEDVGAAAADKRTMVLSPILPPVVRDAIAAIPGGDAALNAMRQIGLAASPSGRTFLNGSLPGARAMGDLAETSLKFTQAAEGQTASTLGTVPISRISRMQQMRFEQVNRDALEDAFTQYRGKSGPSILVRAQAAVENLTGNNDGKMNFDEFKKQVYLAQTQGGEHPIPEVAKAARDVTAKVYDPVLKFAQSVKDKDGRPVIAEAIGPPKGDKGFAPRVWNKAAIAEDPNGFDNTTASWLDAEQRRHVSIKENLEYLRDQHNKLGEDAEAERQQLRSRMEEQIVDWGGKTTDEAVAALKKREVAEGMRPEATDRLKGADKAVDAAIDKIIKSERLDMSPDELMSLAREIRNRINTAADGRLPYDMPSGGPQLGYGEANPVRGSLNGRDFAIPTANVLKYVHTDMEHVVPAYLRTIIPDLHLMKRFGDVEMSEQFKKVNEWYDGLAAKETDAKKLMKIDASRKAEVRDLAATRDRIRGVYGMPTNQTQRNFGRVARAVGNWNVGTFLGTSMLNRFQDMANATARRGLLGYMGDGFLPFIKGASRIDAGSAASRQFMKDIGVGVDTVSGHSASLFWDVVNNHLPGNRFERGLRASANTAMIVTGHTPWTDMNKQIAGMAASAEFLRMADRIAEGAHTERDIRSMAHAGIDPAMARRISKSFNDGGFTQVGDAKVPNTADWKDAGAREAFEAAIQKDADIAVITPGAEKPLFLSDPTMALLGQFKGFAFAAQERILISNLQEADGRTLQGLLHMLGMGAMSYAAYSLATGQAMSNRPQDWVKEAVTRAGMMGWMSDVNAMQAKFTGGKTDAWRGIGADRPLSRHTSQSALEEMLGPTFALLNGVAQAGTDASFGAWSAKDTHKLRQAMFLQNHFLIRKLLDEAEDGFNQHLGIKPLNRDPTVWAGGPPKQ